jgi:N-acetylmuramoyl-L-alanine amidase
MVGMRDLFQHSTLTNWASRFAVAFLLTLTAILTVNFVFFPSLEISTHAQTPSQKPQQGLFVAYPPTKHETTADKIFVIGTAPPKGEVLVNGNPISRNAAGHFAPSFPLQLGENRLTLRHGTQEQQLSITRLSALPQIPAGNDFLKDSLSPAVNLGRQPNERICFSAIAAPKATVSVKLADQTIPLAAQSQVELPSNQAVLTNQNQPQTATTTTYRGCAQTIILGDLGKPMFEFSIDGRTTRQQTESQIHILSPSQLEIAEVSVENGTARTGASTDHSRLTPLPKGTQASITGYEGDWLRLDYGGWIKRSEVQVRKASVPPTSIIRSVKARRAGDWTEIVFPLQVPVPIMVQQGDRTFTLTLYNTTAQTDTIKLSDDPLISRLDWQQIEPGKIEYTFNLKSNQQWGYKLRYEGTSLILSLKHPPTKAAGQLKNTTLNVKNSTLKGIKVVLDPGHGGPDDLGARGPTGYPEKNVALTISKLVRQELQKRGAMVIMTREKDVDMGLKERVDLITKEQPAIALSLHYNALPDNGDALKTKGISIFWYHTQAHGLAMHLHNYLVNTLKRPSDGVYWNNLALTRPANTPSILLELGFMINPDEFEWIMNPMEQKKLAVAIADGIVGWVNQSQITPLA